MSDDKQPGAPVDGNNQDEEKPRLSQVFADAVTAGMGSWKFIFGQTIVLAAWIFLNTTTVLPVPHWDPNLTLLNLGLSCEAAFAGAFILMSQNRQGEKDRLTLQNDYHVDLKSAHAINELNRKLDSLLAVVPPEQLKAWTQATDPAPPAKVSNDNGDAATQAVKRAAKPGGP